MKHIDLKIIVDRTLYCKTVRIDNSLTFRGEKNLSAESFTGSYTLSMQNARNRPVLRKSNASSTIFLSLGIKFQNKGSSYKSSVPSMQNAALSLKGIDRVFKKELYNDIPNVCVASVKKMFTVKGVHLENLCEALFETFCITSESHIEP
jgi:hypothetical protein